MELTINNRKQLEVGKTYTFGFAGKRYRGECISSGENKVLIRNASGSQIPHMIFQTRFKDCVEVQ
jgi:hypothetical protein